MCIRDRSKEDPDHGGEHDGGDRCRERDDDGPFRALRPLICLLYTSDAADDLLCVDLGGRRIIKKKK